VRGHMLRHVRKNLAAIDALAIRSGNESLSKGSRRQPRQGAGGLRRGDQASAADRTDHASTVAGAGTVAGGTLTLVGRPAPKLFD
jgi:hypothetical protein